MGSHRMPKPDDQIAEHPTVTTPPMFGQLAAFVNENMFMGIHGRDVFLRLPELERDPDRGGRRPTEAEALWLREGGSCLIGRRR